VRGPGTVPGALVAAPPLMATLVPPEVGHTGPGVGRGLGAKQLPSLLGVSLLQVVQLVGLVVLEACCLLSLLLEEGLKLKLLLLLELPVVVILHFLQFLLLLSMDDRNFIHQGLDLIDDLVSVGLVDVWTKGDFALLGALRYGRHTEHLGQG